MALKRRRSQNIQSVETRSQKIDERSLDHLLIIRPADDADLFLPFGKLWRRSKADVTPAVSIIEEDSKTCAATDRLLRFCDSKIVKKQLRAVISQKAAASHL